MKGKSIYRLTEISKWNEEHFVSLPKVQRAFVWKPYQIENLWDSLLRGFPIGSFVLSENKHRISDEDARYEIIDGQQRITSIMLGFGKETFKESGKNFRVFIDLHPPENNNSRKYIFRVISRSHPWGYNLKDNSKTLIAGDIRRALEDYNVEDYLKADLGDFYPFDAKIPVPFEYFVKLDDPNELLIELKKWKHWKKIKEGWLAKVKDNTLESRTGFYKSQLKNEKEIESQVLFLHSKVKEMLSDENGQSVPTLYLDFDKFRNELKDEVQSYDNRVMYNDDEDLSEEDEIENLFLRLNSGGTPLRGEDLNYSILKSRLDWKIQEDIEKKCKGLFSPSRFITIAYRLYQHRASKQENLPLNMRIKPKDFQRSIENETREFQGFIEELINHPKYDEKLTLLEYVMKLLKYDSKKLRYGLPFLIVSKISESAPELMFLLLFRIHYMRDRFKLESDLHRRMLGMMTMFVWMGKGEGNRDHSKLLRSIWPCAKKLPLASFWSSSTIERAQLLEVLTHTPDFRRLKKIVTKVKPRADTRITKKFSDIESFINIMFRANRELVMYSQRQFLSEFFDEDVFNLDDTNLPFDWDHIFPYDLIRNKRKVPVIMKEKEWFGTIGNFRAWPYSMNRMDQNKTPYDKFHPTIDKQMDRIKEKWNLKTDFQLHKHLREWSFCEKEMAECRVSDIKNEFKTVYELIRDRNIKICKSWYDELRIDSVLPRTVKQFSLESVINSNSWMDINGKTIVSKIRNPEESQKGIVSSSPYHLDSSRISFYFLFDETLGDVFKSKVEFGIIEENSNKSARLLERPVEYTQWIPKPALCLIANTFELISNHKDSYTKLLQDCNMWLTSSSSKKANSISEEFITCLSTHYQKVLIEIESRPE